mmetsp:Transcript_26041/g.104193  ORF Transcript_26041/g.104193 Transcript_26041/m.104193 type:complete len:230 (+) Transcript_26041:484-1173(+)
MGLVGPDVGGGASVGTTKDRGPWGGGEVGVVVPPGDREDPGLSTSSSALRVRRLCGGGPAEGAAATGDPTTLGGGGGLSSGPPPPPTSCCGGGSPPAPEATSSANQSRSVSSMRSVRGSGLPQTTWAPAARCSRAEASSAVAEAMMPRKLASTSAVTRAVPRSWPPLLSSVSSTVTTTRALCAKAAMRGNNDSTVACSWYDHAASRTRRATARNLRIMPRRSTSESSQR